MTRKQETISMMSGTALLVVALGFMVLVSVPSDPVEGAEKQLAILQLSIMALSFVFGSSAMALFIAARNSAVGKPLRSAGQSALLGFALIALPICAVAILIEQVRTSALIGFVLFVPFLAYLGGGYLLLALRSLLSRAT